MTEAEYKEQMLRLGWSEEEIADIIERNKNSGSPLILVPRERDLMGLRTYYLNGDRLLVDDE